LFHLAIKKLTVRTRSFLCITGQGHDIFGMQPGQGAQGIFGGVGQRLVAMGDPEFQDNYQGRPSRELVCM